MLHIACMQPILCGDLNATEYSDEIRYLTGNHRGPNGRSSLMAMVDAWHASCVQ